MSWWYNYYLGYKKDGKIYPLGPYDSKGQIHSVFARSRSFASKLYEEFQDIQDDEITDELKAAFPYEFKEDEDKDTMFRMPKMGVLPLDSLPKGDYIKRGYYLSREIEEYLRTDDAEGLFYDRMSPEVYAAKLAVFLASGNKPLKKITDGEGADDDCGDVYEDDYEHNVADYMYFCYPDYQCMEYECTLLRNAADSYEYADIVDGAEIVVLMTQG